MMIFSSWGRIMGGGIEPQRRGGSKDVEEGLEDLPIPCQILLELLDRAFLSELDPKAYPWTLKALVPLDPDGDAKGKLLLQGGQLSSVAAQLRVAPLPEPLLQALLGGPLRASLQVLDHLGGAELVPLDYLFEHFKHFPQLVQGELEIPDQRDEALNSVRRQLEENGRAAE